MLAKLYRKQADEERTHALKILDYIPTVEGHARLQAIPEPPMQFDTPLAAIQAALDHERKVTDQINALMALADQENDHATRVLLRWFVEEQVEEVDSQLHLLQVAKMAGPNILQLEAYVAHLVS
jgi:ferritin